MTWDRRGVILYPRETVERDDVLTAIAQAYVDVAGLETFENERAMFDKAPQLSADWGATETHGVISTGLTPELATALKNVLDAASIDGLKWYILDAATDALIETNDTAREGAPLDWQADMPIKAGLTYRDGGQMFTANMDHTSQADWRPSLPGMLALFRPYMPPGETRVWKHPGTWGYPPNARVLWPDEDGDVYVNTLPQGTPNVWEPGDVGGGWVVEGAVSACPDYEQRFGHNPYMRGDCVTFTDGVQYWSKVDNNVYSPSEYPPNWSTEQVV